MRNWDVLQVQPIVGAEDLSRQRADHPVELYSHQQGTLRRRPLAWAVLDLWYSMARQFYGDIGRLWPYSVFLRFEVKIIGSQVTMCAWNPTPATPNRCAPSLVACDPIRARRIIFEGSLAEKLRFRASKLHFWRKSRRKACFFEFHSFIFEGSLAEKLRFKASKLHFCRKSRRKASF